jgi:Uri superfamily endonuclease
MQPGIYVLLLYGNTTELKVGSLGSLSFSKGYYAYVGSALGPGGLSRVSRHIRVAREREQTPRWHIDYILMNKRFNLLRAYCLKTHEPLECLLAKALLLPSIPSFGSSDCSCASHLFVTSKDPDALIINACRSLGGNPVIHTIRNPHRDHEPFR